MSTEFTVEPTLSEEAFLASSFAGLKIKLEREYDLDNTRSSGHMRVYSIQDEAERQYVWAFFLNGTLSNFERYGQNRVRSIFRQIVEAHQLKVTNELGAVMGVDDWFDD